MEKYKTVCCVSNGSIYTYLYSGLFDTPEEAKNFAEKLRENNLILGYGISYTRNGKDFFIYDNSKGTKEETSGLERVDSGSWWFQIGSYQEIRSSPST